MITLSGIGLTQGTAAGPALIVRPDAVSAIEARQDGTDRERIQAARRIAQLTLRERATALPDGPARQIMAAHAALVDDPLLTAEFERGLVDGLAASEAVRHAGESLSARLSRLEDPELRARAADIRDVCSCIISHLGGESVEIAATEGCIVCASELSAAQVLHLWERRPAGLVLETPVATSHAAILIRALAIPAVISVGGITSRAADGDRMLVDASAGCVVLHPDSARLERVTPAGAPPSDPLPARTTDGVDIAVTASAVDADDVRRAAAAGADGIGLLRTDWLFLRGHTLPPEEVQYRMYRDAAAAANAPVTVRLLDLGSDKKPAALPLRRDPNPALGLRGIRLAFAYPDLLRTQLRALRRAFEGRLRLLLPMITDAADVARVREFLAEPDAAGPVEIGVMIETPAAALMADELAAVADFFSLGTNDLAQYVLAADREAASSADSYRPLHPAVLRLVHGAAAAANRRSTPVSICGELAGDERAVPLLIGLGITELTVAPGDVARIKRIVRETSASAARQLAQEVLSLPTAAAVEARLDAMRHGQRHASTTRHAR